MGNASSASAAPSLKPTSETSSSCVTQGITAAHNFEVTNFSLLEGMGVGGFISSSNFRVGGYDWSIMLFPDGDEHRRHVTAFLIPEGGQQDGVRVRFTFTVLRGKDGKAWKKATSDHTFKSPLQGWGWSSFIYKSRRFRKMLRASNDRFTVRCVLTVIQDPRVVAVVVPEPSVLGDLARMHRDGDGADVTFVVGERSFPAHRCVLAARSAVFRAELLGAMKEKTAARVRVDEMEPSVFEAMLNFIYTDSLPDADADDGDKDSKVAMMQHLLVAADRYGLDRLKAICEVSLCQSIDAQTVATTLALAEQHQFAHLKGACLKFIASQGCSWCCLENKGNQAPCGKVALRLRRGY